MAFQPDKSLIQWKVHFSSPIERVYTALSTDEGRATYWAEKTVRDGDQITFYFTDYPAEPCPVLREEPPHLFSLSYFGTETTFTLQKEGGGTILHLKARVPDKAMREEMMSGWVSVLLAMKAAVDHGVDIRNHNANYSWQQGFADN